MSPRRAREQTANRVEGAARVLRESVLVEAADCGEIRGGDAQPRLRGARAELPEVGLGEARDQRGTAPAGVERRARRQVAEAGRAELDAAVLERRGAGHERDARPRKRLERAVRRVERDHALDVERADRFEEVADPGRPVAALQQRHGTAPRRFELLREERRRLPVGLRNPRAGPDDDADARQALDALEDGRPGRVAARDEALADQERHRVLHAEDARAERLRHRAGGGQPVAGLQFARKDARAVVFGDRAPDGRGTRCVRHGGIRIGDGSGREGLRAGSAGRRRGRP